MTLRNITAALSIFSFLLLFPALAFSQGRVVESESHRFEEVAEGVWLVSGTGSVFTMSNVMVLMLPFFFQIF